MFDNRTLAQLDTKDTYDKCKIAKSIGGNCGSCKRSKIDVVSSREESRPVLLCSFKRDKRVNALAVCGYYESKK
jgi:hypothetical protein